MRHIYRRLGETVDTDVLALLQELRDLRQGQFAHGDAMMVLHYLQAFFLPGLSQHEFVPIGKASVSTEYWLNRKLSDCRGSQVYALCLELLSLEHIPLDNVCGEKVYNVLNVSLKPHCVAMREKKKRPPKPYKARPRPCRPGLL